METVVDSPRAMYDDPMANPLTELRAQLISAGLSPEAAEGKSAFGRALTADEVGYGRPQLDHFIAEGNRIHAELEGRYGVESNPKPGVSN